VSLSLGPRSRVGIISGIGVLLLSLGLVLRGEADLRTQVVGQLVAFALFLPAAALCWRGLGAGRLGLILVLAFAIGFRAMAFEPAGAPPLSTDLYRYSWDARVQAEGINPYRYAPVDSALAPLRDDAIWPEINNPTWKTVYPPGAEASFLAARGVFRDGARATTWLFLLAEAAAICLLLVVLSRSGSPVERIALYAWHPLAVSEIAANGHVDALAVLAGAALLAAWQARRFALSGLAVALGALVKLGPILLLPVLARRGGRRFALSALTLCALAYVPYLSVGTGVVGSLERYVERQRFGGSFWPLLEPRLGETAASLTVALGLAAVVAVVALREHDSVEQVARSCLLALGCLLLAVSYVQPWHALWLLPFLALTAAPGWLWLTGTLPLLYLYGLEHSLPGWIQPAVYGPLLAWAIWRVVRPRRRRVAALPPLVERPRVVAVVPALNEADALPGLLREFPPGVVDEVIVVDGGSRDGTREAAAAAGARVVVEPRRGYGRACAAGAAATEAEILVFLDGDGSDDPSYLAQLLEPILTGEAALSLAARTLSEPAALLPHQRFGNRLVARLAGMIYGCRLHDVPPMRAVRRDVLESLALREMTYGWPTEMVVKAASGGHSLAEISVRSRARRGGESKVSGRLGPSLRAGAQMLTVVVRYA
jgi:hypothetical protein